MTALVNSASVAPKKPSEDPFYVPPDGYESLADGTILRFRETPGPLGATFLPLKTDGSWQILIKSADALGNPNAIVTTIIKPYNADNKKVLSYQTMEDSSFVDCAPSYAFQFGSSDVALNVKLELYVLQTFLDQGWWVVTPDYEGPKALFTVGRHAGQAVLNSLRAVIKSVNQTGISPDAQYAMFGYSGGALASGWAAALQPAYAPDLSGKLIGAALGGWVTNITATLVAVEGTPFMGLAANGIYAIMQQYKEVATYIQSLLSSGDFSRLQKAGQTCLVGSVLEFKFVRFFTGPFRWFKQGYAALQTPLVQGVLDAQTLAIKDDNEIPQIPLFIFHGILDSIVPFKEAQRAYTNWCSWKNDLSIEFAVDQSAGHITEFVQGIPAGIAWVTRLFEDKGIVKGCNRQERLSNLSYPGTDQSIYEFLLAAVKSFVGNDIGPNGNGLII